MKLKKVMMSVLVVSMLLTGCAKDKETEPSQSENLQPVESVETDESPEADTNETGTDEVGTDETGTDETGTDGTRTYEAEEQYVKMLGRTHNENGVLWLAHSASGVEFTVKGTQCSVKIVGDSMTGAEGSQARFVAFVDGERVLDEMITQREAVYEIFSFETEREVTVTLVKVSEAANSILGIDEIIVAAADSIAPTAEKNLKIEFIGDSITCGYGVDDEDRNHHFSTNTEDATRAYAYKTAQLLDADYSLVSYSGNGIVSGYTSQGVKVSEQQFSKKYECFAVSYGNGAGGFKASSVDWDFSKFTPDIVVINLGTNDYSYTGNDEELIREYIEAYTEFIKQVRQNNANSHIICTLGIMGAELYDAICTAVENYTAETGDENISVFRLSMQNGSTGYAADWHPTAATHDIAAAELADYIIALGF